MDVFLPAGFDAVRARAPKSRPARAQRLRVEMPGVTYPVLRRWTNGFAVAADASALHGVVNLYEGDTHLGQCLITGSEASGAEHIFTFKRAANLDYIEADASVLGEHAYS